MENPGHPQEEVTDLLRSAEADGVDPIDRLWPMLYDDLRAAAHRQLRGERAGHTLATTALVNEAYLKLVDSTRVAGRGRAYFYAAAARAMRQILVDYARRRQRLKRKAEDLPPLPEGVDEFATDLLDLHEAMERLASDHPRAARVVEHRFFGGLTVEETASALHVSERTVKTDWALARGWLYRELKSGEPPDG